MEEDVIIIHLGRVVSEELYEEIVESICEFLEKRYPQDQPWTLKS